MILSDVLHILQKQVDSIGIKNTSLYVMFFTDDTNENLVFYNDAAKKVFSNRGLTEKVSMEYCNESGFIRLTEKIEKNYLTLVRQHTSIYNQLRNLIENSKQLPESYKEQLISSCMPENTYQLARFIAACILCGSYHSNQMNAKVKDTEYRFGIDFMNLDRQVITIPFSKKIWKCSQQEFLISHKEGNRFHDLNIIQRLLPKGYVTKNDFHMRAKTTDGRIRSLMDICKEENKDISVIGEGGIGKTTFLQQLLEEEFWDKEKKPTVYASGRPIPIFIELRRCPAQIDQWYEDIYKKTNFITRYIGQMLENHSSLNSVSAEVLTSVEKEMQRIPEDDIPQYMLLLDGFNEVSIAEQGTSRSCRALLSNEISVIHQEYANVRIIATSRKTQSAYFTSTFQNVYLIGLEDDDIKDYLRKCMFSDASIGITLANKTLVKCLRIPLFLCMFSYSKQADNLVLPETPGEILYSFFHRNSFFYNIRKHAEDTHTNPLNELETALVLDFILPYIGWIMEQNDIFSLSEPQLTQIIQDALNIIKNLLIAVPSLPYEDFMYSRDILNHIHLSLTERKDSGHKIIACAFDYLGILYQYNAPEKNIAQCRQYSFIHHHFRDYFSAILDIQLLRMLPFIEIPLFFENELSTYTYSQFLNSHFWNQNKKELISQILMEHRNKPKLNSVSKNWNLPKFDTNEQQVLSDAIDFCRMFGKIYPLHYLLHNALMAIVYGRQELSGMDLTDLNFKHFNIFAIPCSKKGATSTLAAHFDASILPDYFLQPEDHVDNIEEYAYSGQYCYTLDNAGTIKCWDIFSGCLEYILRSGAPNGQYDYSPNGLMKISSDGKWLAAKVYQNEANDCSACLYVFNLAKPDKNPVSLTPNKQHRKITSFSFTDDNKSILYLADQHDIYCFDIETQKEIYSCHCEQFLKQTELYASTAYSVIYAFSGEYDFFDCTEFYPEYEDEESLPEENINSPYIEDIDSDTDWEENSIPTPCVLLRCIPTSQEIEELYSFSGEPGTYPIAKYFSSLDCFLLFNEENRQLEKFNCSHKEAEIVWEELTIENGNASPSSIQYCPGHPKECYIIYPQCSYNVDLVTHKQNGILMKYDVSALSKLINNDSEMEELIFYPNVIPNRNRFIIRNSENTYEWDTANDTLRRRYNTALYECRDMILDKIHDLGILVHQFNGISVFSGRIPKLVNAYCYPNTEYYASGCCYHEVTQNLAIMFSKASHEYVEIINLQTSKREIVFSTLLAHETLESIQFHPDGRYLLITLEDKCMEYHLSSKKTFLVEKAGDNELFIDGSYTDEERPMIRIAIVEHFNYDKPRIEPHCDHYFVNHTSKNTVYKKDWRYYMPTLTHETAANFLHYSYDIGNGCSYTEKEYQTYWCTCGFFLHDFPDDDAFRHIRCSKFIGNREQKITKNFGRLQMIFCRHDFALATQYRTERNCNNYSYCSNDFSQVIEIFDHHNITYWKDLSVHPTSERYVYNNGEKTSDEIAYSYWDTVIPWFSDSLLSCYEQYHLMLLKKAGHGESIEILYTPGIAINGCSFYGVKANDKLKQELVYNGGKI